MVWHKILTHFLNRGYINNGLTIPFLIGLYPKNSLTVRTLLTEFYESKDNIFVSIQKCDCIDEYVVGIYINEQKNNLQINHYKRLGSIIFTDNSLDFINSLEDLINHFENSYLEIIQNDKHSKNDGEWTKYTSRDLTLISEVI